MTSQMGCAALPRPRRRPLGSVQSVSLVACDAARLKCCPRHRRHTHPFGSFGPAGRPTSPTVSSTGSELAVRDRCARVGELQPARLNPARMVRAEGCSSLTPAHTHACSLMPTGTAARPRKQMSGQRSRLEWHRSVWQQHLTSVAGDDACSARAIALELCVVSRGCVPERSEPDVSALARLHSRAEPAA